MNHAIRLSVIICVLLYTGSLLAGNTPETYTDTGTSASNTPGNIATSWSESKNIKWKTAIHGRGWSTPVITGDQIWITTATEDGKKIYAVCISKESGKILHDILVGDVSATNIIWKCSENVPGIATPVISNGLIFMVSEKGILSCLDAKTGQLFRKEKLQGNYNFNTAPVEIEDKIYLTDLDGATTIIKADRKFQVVAENKLEGKFIARPVVSGNSLIMRSDTHIYRIENSR